MADARVFTKAYLLKSFFTRGPEVVEVTQIRDYWSDRRGSSVGFYHRDDLAFTFDEAVEKIEALRKKKRAALEKQIARLNRIQPFPPLVEGDPIKSW